MSIMFVTSAFAGPAKVDGRGNVSANPLRRARRPHGPPPGGTLRLHEAA